MADNGEHWNKKATEGGQGNAPEKGVARSNSNDPLAELARLIDEDPFADFDRARAQTTPQDGQTNIEWEVEPSDPPASMAEPDPQPVFKDEVEPYAADPGWDDPHDGVPEDYLARLSGLQGAGLPEPHETEPHETEPHETEPHPPHDGGFFASAAAEPEPATADDPGHAAYDPVAALEAHLLGHNASEDGSAGHPTEGRDWESFHDAHEIHRPEPEWLDPPFEPDHSGDGAPPRDLDLDEDLFAREPAEFVEDSHAGPANADPVSGHGSDLDPWDDAAQVSPAYYDEEVSARRSRRGLAVLGSLVGLVVLGGAVALGYRGLGGDPGGDPPVIRADSSPTKVMAEDEAEADSESGSKLVYDRIGGHEPQQEERLVSREEPVFDVVGRDGQFADGGPGGDIELRGGTDESTVGASNQPRRVRTVVVRPDGTVVGPTEESTEVAASEPQQVPSAPQAPQAAQQEQEAGQAIEESFSGPSDAGMSTGESEAVTDQAESDAVAASESAEPASATAATQDEAPQPDSGQPLRIIPNGTGGQAEQSGTTPENDEAEIARAPAASETEQSLEEPSESDAGVTTPFPSGSYVVQIASTRSEDDARNMASRATQDHSSLLEGYQTGIQEADLGDRGIFYRVGVGPMSDRSDATALCERMQSAGLDCFVRQN